MHQLTNLTNFLLKQHGHSTDAVQLAQVINQIVFASKIISREVNKAGLVDILGSTGGINTTGDEVQKLDDISNTMFVELLRQLPQVRAVGSEELEDIVLCNENDTTGKYIVLLDPIDGSSNIDVNVSTGTIFSIYKKISKGKACNTQDYLQPGSKLLAAGYTLYGSSTMLVLSTGYGVHGFTLDPTIGEYLLSHEHLKYPKETTIYSVNEAYSPRWDEVTRQQVENFKTGKNPLIARYIGSLVADFHRNLLKGGIYLYPGDKKNPQGKLRLVFEAIPLAYLSKQAGGMASDGEKNILDLKPTALHQRVPLVIGNAS